MTFRKSSPLCRGSSSILHFIIKPRMGSCHKESCYFAIEKKDVQGVKLLFCKIRYIATNQSS